MLLASGILYSFTMLHKLFISKSEFLDPLSPTPIILSPKGIMPEISTRSSSKSQI